MPPSALPATSPRSIPAQACEAAARDDDRGKPRWSTAPICRRQPRPARLPFGLPGAYWLDLRDYDPVATAAALDKPMLILQGGRDYQVTVEDDLARLAGGPR